MVGDGMAFDYPRALEGTEKEIHIDSMDESSKFGSVGLPEAEELVKYVAREHSTIMAEYVVGWGYSADTLEFRPLEFEAPKSQCSVIFLVSVVCSSQHQIFFILSEAYTRVKCPWSCDGRLNMLLKKLTFNVPQLALVAGDISLLGVTASFTQPLDSTSDLVTMIPTVILGAEVLGSELASCVHCIKLWGLECTGVLEFWKEMDSGCSLKVVINEGYCFIPSVDIGQKPLIQEQQVGCSLAIEAGESNCGASVETRWLLITLEHLRLSRTIPAEPDVWLSNVLTDVSDFISVLNFGTVVCKNTPEIAGFFL
ncbi:hypothetical protein Cgig2_018328 [Carnegiea gigantea]|uniref:Uncharacterized protein n=1 Tax=Carnegiea gigantea TaxID=171969 RepID=A0A9Q1QRQ1_9CARY|nr:hypothetical protein Cgig2_018328 [Carnegiea gigantea]